jgi:hypothetical protein
MKTRLTKTESLPTSKKKEVLKAGLATTNQVLTTEEISTSTKGMIHYCENIPFSKHKINV